MPAATAALACVMIAGAFVFVSAEQKTITAESGQDANLTCRAPNSNIIVLKWSRTDLEPEYVLSYQDGHFDPDEQHPSFKNRVDLQDRQMKDGDVSVILKNVTTADSGTYVCSVFMVETRSWNRSSIIYLRVLPPGPTGLKVGLAVMSTLVLLPVVSLLIYKIYKHFNQQQSQDPSLPPTEQDQTEMSQSFLQGNPESPAVPDSH